MTKTAVVYLNKISSPYLIVIDSANGITSNQFDRKGLFNKKFEVRNIDVLYLNEKSFSNYVLKFEGDSGKGMTIFSGSKPEYNFNWEFILKNSDAIYNQKLIDSLIEKKADKKLRNENFRGYK